MAVGLRMRTQDAALLIVIVTGHWTASSRLKIDPQATLFGDCDSTSVSAFGRESTLLPVYQWILENFLCLCVLNVVAGLKLISPTSVRGSCKKMDSEIQRDGRVLDLTDDAWREDRLPYEDVTIPLVSTSLADPSTLDIEHREQNWELTGFDLCQHSISDL